MAHSRPGPEADVLRYSAEKVLMQALVKGGLRGAERAIKGAAEAVEVATAGRQRTLRAWRVRCRPRLWLAISVVCGGGVRCASVMFEEERAPRTKRQKEIDALQEAFYERYNKAASVAYRGGRQSAADRVILMVGELEADLNNGGFQQYLENKGAARARAALAALSAAGAEATARLLESALERAGDARALERLDRQFHKLAEDLPTLVMRHQADASANDGGDADQALSRRFR